MARVEHLYSAILRGEARRTERIIQAELDRDADPVELMMESMAPALQELGARYERGEAFLPDLMVSARAMNAGLGLLAATYTPSSGLICGRVGVREPDSSAVLTVGVVIGVDTRRYRRWATADDHCNDSAEAYPLTG